MEKLNLVLKFQLEKEAELQVRGAARIIINGRDGLVLHHSDDGVPETIQVAGLQTLSIRPVRIPSRAVTVAHAA